MYRLTTEALGDFYSIASDSNLAVENLEAILDKADYGFTGSRKVKNIEIVAKELKDLNFSSGNRLLIA